MIAAVITIALGAFSVGFIAWTEWRYRAIERADSERIAAFIKRHRDRG